MNDTQQLTDTDIRAAFIARSTGAPAHDLLDRIHAMTTTTKQERRLVTLPALGRFAPARQLLIAATIGAVVLAVAGSLLIAGPGSRPPGGVVVPPSDSPTAVPSQRPTVEPSLTPVTLFAPGTVVRIIGAPGDVRPLYQLATPESDQVGEVGGGITAYVNAGPVVVDGVDWYQVMPFGSDTFGYPLAWLPALDDAGQPTLEAEQIACPSGELTPDILTGLGSTAALACFGSDEITVIGRVSCEPRDAAEREVTGPFWLDDGRLCAFVDPLGEPVLEIFGFPTDELPPDWRTVDLAVQGRYDHPESVDCVGKGAVDDLRDDEAVFACRQLFHSAGVTVAP